MTQTKVYFELSDEIQQLLTSNKITIKDILRNEDINAEVTYGVLPYEVEGERSKDIVAIVIVASVAVVAVSSAIAKVLNTYYRRPQLIEFWEYEEVRDLDGKIMLDAEGNPLFKLVKRCQLLEPRQENQKTNIEFGFDLEKGLVIKINSEEKQMNERLNLPDRI